MDDENEIPTQPRYVAWRSEMLAAVNPATGRPLITAGDFTRAVGALPAGRTWRQLRDEWAAFLHASPRGIL